MLGDLTGMPSLSSVEAVVLTSNPALTSLTGLGPVTSLVGRGGSGLIVVGNPMLGSLSGLESVTTIGGSSDIRDNDALVDLSGLDALQTIERLNIEGNLNLSSLSGLDMLTSVGGGNPNNNNLIISDNDALVDLTGLGALQTVGRQLTVRRNAAMTSLDGLGPLTSVGQLVLEDMPLFGSLAALSSLQSSGFFRIVALGALTSFAGLEALATITDTIVIENNPQLVQISQLAPTAFSGFSVIVRNNANLCDIDVDVFGGLINALNPGANVTNQNNLLCMD
jgi:hypothetical protein